MELPSLLQRAEEMLFPSIVSCVGSPPSTGIVKRLRTLRFSSMEV